MRDTLYSESAYYRMLFRERTHDIDFYARVTAPDPGGEEHEVLELGVGTGRIALALAERGRRVRGVDASASMLAGLQEQKLLVDPAIAARVDATHADARTLRLGQTFARVIFPFNGLAHFHDAEEQAAIFATVKAHLAPGGLFAFDLMIPDPRLLAGGGASVSRLVHPRTGAVCRMEETCTYDAIRQVLSITTRLIERETEAEQVLTLLLRQFFPQETLLLLEHHGFVVVARSEELGDTLAYVCRPR